MRNNWMVIFDLDDTLYKEIDFLKSAYKEIAGYLASKTNKSQVFLYNEMIHYYTKGLNTFQEILNFSGVKELSVKDLVSMYRDHVPDITLKPENIILLEYLKQNNFKMGLITDGRSKQQRNKIKALKLDAYLDAIVISEEIGTEKPNLANFKYFKDRYPNSKFIYIGDNTSKDFIAPNSLGWTTICMLDDGNNIHKQNLELEQGEKPLLTINNLSELKDILNKIS